MKRIFSEVTDMKRVLIINGEGAALENIAIRSVLEYFGYIVTMYNIGRPQDYFRRITLMYSAESYISTMTI